MAVLGSATRFTRGAILRLAILLVLAALLPSPATTHAEEQKVTVFAAASLKNAMDEIAAGWKQQTGGEVLLVFAGSSALARQIIHGAPADILISANTKWMDAVEDAGLTQSGSRTGLLANDLVLITHGVDKPEIDLNGFDLAAALGSGRLAMALVDAVPAGIYGKAALQSLGMWDGVKNNVAQTDNVRAALALVESGEAPFGIVYATDAKASRNISILAAFPAGSHPPIIYPAAALTGGRSSNKESFLKFLKNRSSIAAFKRQGFKVLD